MKQRKNIYPKITKLAWEISIELYDSDEPSVVFHTAWLLVNRERLISRESLSENSKSTLKNKSEVSSSINQVENQDLIERCELKNALTENQETGSPGWLEPTAQSLRNQQKVSTKYQQRLLSTNQVPDIIKKAKLPRGVAKHLLLSYADFCVYLKVLKNE